MKYSRSSSPTIECTKDTPSDTSINRRIAKILHETILVLTRQTAQILVSQPLVAINHDTLQRIQEIHIRSIAMVIFYEYLQISSNL